MYEPHITVWKGGNGLREQLVKARKVAHLTQGQVAAAVGIDRTVYNRIEHGIRKPTVDIALRIARVVDRRVEDLFLPNDVDELHNEQEARSAV